MTCKCGKSRYRTTSGVLIEQCSRHWWEGLSDRPITPHYNSTCASPTCNNQFNKKCRQHIYCSHECKEYTQKLNIKIMKDKMEIAHEADRQRTI